MSIQNAKDQVALARHAFEGDAAAMQRMTPVETIPQSEAVRKLQVQILHLGNALAELIDELETSRWRR